MNIFDENAIYGFVSSDMALRFESSDKDFADLHLLLADMNTIIILQEKGIGCWLTSCGLTLNQTKALMLGNRFAYCCSCGRFSSDALNAIKNEFLKLGKTICVEWFDKSLSEAIRFANNERDFLALQHYW